MTTMFDAQPSLAGELVELRPLQESDFEDLSAVASDAAIWEQHPDPSRFQRAAFRTFFSDHLSSGGALLVFDRQAQVVIRVGSRPDAGCRECLLYRITS